MIWIPAAVCAAYNIVYIVHCLKFKRFRAAVGMALLAAAVAAAVISIQLNSRKILFNNCRNGRAAYVHVT